MKLESIGKIGAAIACFGIVMPTAGLAASPTSSNVDVALRPGGVLVGQVVNQQGAARPNATVSVRSGNFEVVRTTTDAEGVFAAKGLRGGQYEILTVDGSRTCRLWAADTAPPAAREAALVISDEHVVRGQAPAHVNAWVDWMKAHPFLTAGTVAVAVATPLAFLDDDDENGS
jgi:hypothetical protein